MKPRKAIPKMSKKRQAQVDAGLKTRGTIVVKNKSLASFKKTLAIEEMLDNAMISTANKLVSKPKPRKKIRPRAPRKDGMTQPKVFRHIWETREHKCEVCGDPVHEATLSNFSHLLGKGAYPSLKYYEPGIEIWCKTCHRKWTDHDLSHKELDSPEWKRVILKCDELRNIANGITNNP